MLRNVPSGSVWIPWGAAHRRRGVRRAWQDLYGLKLFCQIQAKMDLVMYPIFNQIIPSERFRGCKSAVHCLGKKTSVHLQLMYMLIYVILIYVCQAVLFMSFLCYKHYTVYIYALHICTSEYWNQTVHPINF